jgi:DNA-directed RNA polymerase subunit RPC12/RpoP
MKPCSRCGQRFRAIHGNQLYCPNCRLKRPRLGRHRYTTEASFGRRVCVACGRPYEARADNQRFCSQRCKDRAKPTTVKTKYADPSHRLGRKAWAPAVRTSDDDTGCVDRYAPRRAPRTSLARRGTPRTSPSRAAGVRPQRDHDAEEQSGAKDDSAWGRRDRGA